MNKNLAAAKKFVRRNRNAIVVGAVAVSVIALQQSGIRSLNDFLKEHDLFDEYYFVDEED